MSSPKDKELRINRGIRARQVRVVSDQGEQLGIMELFRALALAESKGLDLVEVAPDGVPPVCRLLNYGKFKYAQRKKDKETSKKQRVVKVKEIKIRTKIDEHDYQTKLRMAQSFLDYGDRVKCMLVFRGREISHKELGVQLMARIVSDLADWGVTEAPPKDEGMMIVTLFNPLPQKPEPKPEPAKEKEKQDGQAKA